MHKLGLKIFFSSFGSKNKNFGRFDMPYFHLQFPKVKKNLTGFDSKTILVFNIFMVLTGNKFHNFLNRNKKTAIFLARNHIFFDIFLGDQFFYCFNRKKVIKKYFYTAFSCNLYYFSGRNFVSDKLSAIFHDKSMEK